MDWSKVDAGLAGALADDDASRRYFVFVHLATGADPDVLAQLDITTSGQGTVRTATLSAAEVDRLTDHAAVSRLRLARPLGLHDPT